MRSTQKYPRCDLLGILLPNQSDYGAESYNPRLIPPKMADNCVGDDPYAGIYDWLRGRVEAHLREWIHRAFIGEDGTPASNVRQYEVGPGNWTGS